MVALMVDLCCIKMQYKWKGSNKWRLYPLMTCPADANGLLEDSSSLASAKAMHNQTCAHTRLYLATKIISPLKPVCLSGEHLNLDIRTNGWCRARLKQKRALFSRPEGCQEFFTQLLLTKSH